MKKTIAALFAITAPAAAVSYSIHGLELGLSNIDDARREFRPAEIKRCADRPSCSDEFIITPKNASLGDAQRYRIMLCLDGKTVCGVEEDYTLAPFRQLNDNERKIMFFRQSDIRIAASREFGRAIERDVLSKASACANPTGRRILHTDGKTVVEIDVKAFDSPVVSYTDAPYFNDKNRAITVNPTGIYCRDFQATVAYDLIIGTEGQEDGTFLSTSGHDFRATYPEAIQSGKSETGGAIYTIPAMFHDYPAILPDKQELTVYMSASDFVERISAVMPLASARIACSGYDGVFSRISTADADELICAYRLNNGDIATIKNSGNFATLSVVSAEDEFSSDMPNSNGPYGTTVSGITLGESWISEALELLPGAIHSAHDDGTDVYTFSYRHSAPGEIDGYQITQGLNEAAVSEVQVSYAPDNDAFRELGDSFAKKYTEIGTACSGGENWTRRVFSDENSIIVLGRGYADGKARATYILGRRFDRYGADMGNALKPVKQEYSECFGEDVPVAFDLIVGNIEKHSGDGSVYFLRTDSNGITQRYPGAYMSGGENGESVYEVPKQPHLFPIFSQESFPLRITMSPSDEVMSVVAVGVSGTYAEHLCGLTPGAAAISENEVLCQQRAGGLVMRATASADYPGYFDITYSDIKYDAAKVAVKHSQEMKAGGNAATEDNAAETGSVDENQDSDASLQDDQNQQENQELPNENGELADQNAAQNDPYDPNSQESEQSEY